MEERSGTEDDENGVVFGETCPGHVLFGVNERHVVAVELENIVGDLSGNDVDDVEASGIFVWLISVSASGVVFDLDCRCWHGGGRRWWCRGWWWRR